MIKVFTDIHTRLIWKGLSRHILNIGLCNHLQHTQECEPARQESLQLIWFICSFEGTRRKCAAGDVPFYWFRQKGQNVNNMDVGRKTNNPPATTTTRSLTIEAQSPAPTISAAFSSICKEWELHEWTRQQPLLDPDHKVVEWGALTRHNTLS